MAKLELTKNITLSTTDLELVVDTNIVNYIISGTPTLIEDVNISLIGTPIEGMVLNVYYTAIPDLDGNSLIMFGTNISNYSEGKIKVECTYANAQWNYSFSNFNSFNLESNSIATDMIQLEAITTAKIAPLAVTPSKLNDNLKTEVIEITLDADSVSNRTIIPYFGVLKYISWYCLENFDASSKNVTFSLNINGSSTTTSYPSVFASSGSPIVKGDSGVIASTPSAGIDVLGSSYTHYIEITLTQDDNQGGRVKFFLIMEPRDPS